MKQNFRSAKKQKNFIFKIKTKKINHFDFLTV